MFDLILGWAVVMLPFLFAIGVELVPKEQRDDRRWKWGIIAFGLLLSIVTFFQMQRATTAAKADKDGAIVETSTRVSASVTKAVTEQYQGLIADQKKQISDLQAQVTEQGRDVSVIKGSNIVTGKHPIKVEVEAPQRPTPKIEGITVLSVTQLPSSPYPEAPYGIRVVVQATTTLQPTQLGLECDHDILRADFTAGENFTGMTETATGKMNNADGKPNDKTWAIRVTTPAFSPEVPWIMKLYGKEELHLVSARSFP
jgi:hypothetical protein